jgi:hypothetical protein
MLAGTSPVALNLITDNGALVLPDSDGGYIDFCVFSNPDGVALRMTDNTTNLMIGPNVCFVAAKTGIQQMKPGRAF